jgi:hypothetical protein
VASRPLGTGEWLPPDRVYTAKDTAVLPQHQELMYFDPRDPPGTIQRFTIYTDELLVDFDSGDTGDQDLIFQYPILGTFIFIGPVMRLATIPIAALCVSTDLLL